VFIQEQKAPFYYRLISFIIEQSAGNNMPSLIVPHMIAGDSQVNGNSYG